MQIELEKPDLFKEELEALLELERQARQDSRMEESVRLVEEITDLIWRAQDIEELKKVVTTLTSKRGQPIKAITKMVMKCMAYIPQIKDAEKRIDYVRTMKTVCEKKIYLEVEYARCCMRIVKYKENQGASKEDIMEAAKIMENVQVETYGSMDKYEKIEFILYQMKLNIMLEDLTKLIIVSKKVNPKFFKEESFAKLEVTYYLYKLHYHQNKDEHDESAECLNKVHSALLKMENWDTDKTIVEETDNRQKDYDKMVYQLYPGFLEKGVTCQSFISLLLLTDFSKEKIETLKKEWETHHTYLDNNYGLRNLVQAFLSMEISSCNLEDYKLEDMVMFDKYGLYNNRYHAELERQLIKKNLYTGTNSFNWKSLFTTATSGLISYPSF